MADLVASGIVPLSAKFHLFGKGACADEEAGEKKKKKQTLPPVFKHCINEEGYTSWIRFLILMKIASYKQCPSVIYNQEEAGAQV